MTPLRRQQIANSISPSSRTLVEWTRGFLDLYTKTDPVPPEDMSQLLVSAMMVPHYVRKLLREHRNDNSDMFRAADIPIAFVVGENDAFTQKPQLEEIIGRLPNARMLTIANAGGLPFWTAPDAFNECIKQLAREFQNQR